MGDRREKIKIWLASANAERAPLFKFTAPLRSSNLAVRPLLYYPHPNLRKVSATIRDFDDEVRALGFDLEETMAEEQGLGLSAPQINVLKRLIVWKPNARSREIRIMANPSVSCATDPQDFEEGCLSFPGIYEKIRRPHRITVTGQDTTGMPYTHTAEGLEAVCIQHEIDHLDGKLFVDYISKLRLNRIRKQMSRVKG